MPYPTRTPAIKLRLGIEIFNSLLERLNIDSALKSDDKVIDKSSKLKEKLLRYSVPRSFENGIVMIDIRLFPNEASFLLERLLETKTPEEISVDYYSVLLKVREENKKQES